MTAQENQHPADQICTALMRASGILAVVTNCFDADKKSFAVNTHYLQESVAAVESLLADASAALTRLYATCDLSLHVAGGAEEQAVDGPALQAAPVAPESAERPVAPATAPRAAEPQVEWPAAAAVQRPMMAPIEWPTAAPIQMPAMVPVERTVIAPPQRPAMVQAERPAVSPAQRPAMAPAPMPAMAPVQRTVMAQAPRPVTAPVEWPTAAPAPSVAARVPEPFDLDPKSQAGSPASARPSLSDPPKFYFPEKPPLPTRSLAALARYSAKPAARPVQPVAVAPAAAANRTARTYDGLLEKLTAAADQAAFHAQQREGDQALARTLEGLKADLMRLKSA